MAQKSVAIGHAGRIVTLANEIGVARGAFDHVVNTYLPPLLHAARRGNLPSPDDFRRLLFPAVQAPPGGRIYEFSIPVHENRKWEIAISQGCPDTPADHTVWKVAHLFVPVRKGTRMIDFAVVNFGRGFDFDADGVAWGASQRLVRSTPRDVFAVAEYKRNLNCDLGMDQMYLSSTEKCTFEGDRHVCVVWFIGSERRAGLCGVADVGSPVGWLLFRRE